MHPSAVAAARGSANTYRFIGPKCKGKRSQGTRAVGTLMEHRRPGIAPGSLEHRHREERPEVVVGHAQPGRQQPHHRPQHLVGDVAVEIEQQLEVGAGDGDQRTRGVGDRVGGALGAVEDHHLAEAGARLEDGQGFLPGPGDGAGDAHLALRNNEEPVARLPFLEDLLADGELLLPADLGHAGQLAVARTGLLHPLEIVGVVARDIVAALGYVGAWLWRRPTALPARAGGKAVTVLQLLTLVAFIARSPLVRPLAWATATVGLDAIWDYGRAAARARAMLTRGKGT